MSDDNGQGDSGWVNTFVFIAGFLLGAGTAIMLTPESGNQLRSRIARGARTAQDEFSDMAAQTKEAMHAWSEEAKETMKHAANRVNSAVGTTKNAVKSPPLESLDD
ncbi:MAG: YtxH domain-containing protein [Nitrospirota bacterium]|nr:YtxH domain-containing protein [Nitrospirota bacterium]MDH5587899.1 YtxH domain-containing protein [Nitrospirota bacterium]